MFRLFFPFIHHSQQHIKLNAGQWRRFLVDNSNCYTKTQKTNGVNSDPNEWLWEYLRQRQSFQVLNEEQKRQIILMEVETLRESGERVPNQIPNDFWPEILSAPLLSARKSIYNHLFIREITKQKRAREKLELQKRQIKSVVRRAELAAAGLPTSNYPGHKTIFRQLHGGQTERWLRDSRLIAQARLNEHVVVDCGFEISHVRSKSISKIVDQIEYFFSNIHLYHSPCFVTLCNVAFDGQIQQEFHRRFSRNSGVTCFETTEKSYLDLFDRDRLIYLSPNSPFEMSEYDHDAIYIIGAIGDLNSRALSLAKAKRDNIRHQRFPFERYLKFGGGASRSLSLDKMYNILMSLKHGQTWSEAFKMIPDRKIAERFDKPSFPRKASTSFNSLEQ